MAVVLAASGAHAAMYRWVDANGRVHYGDTLPSNYQQRGAAELSKQGRVVGRTLSEDERRADAARAAEAAAQKKITDEQARQDRLLRSTYTSEAEIELARDRALDLYRANISSAQTRMKAVGVNVAALDKRVGALEKSGKAVAPALREQQRRARLEAQDLKRAIKNSEQAMQDIVEKYAAEKTRFRELAAREN